MKNDYSKIKIKNLRYNIKLFSLTATISMHTIVSVIYGIKSEENNDFEIKPIKMESLMTHSQNTLEEIEVLEELPSDIVVSETNLKENELENIILIEELEEKEYSGMNLSNELEDEIKRLCDIYGVPYQIVLTIGERESAGSWNNNGVVSKTNDYGEFQINECNLSYIEENLGYTKEEILYDSFKNAEACIFLLKDIVKRDDVTTAAQIFGMYNGWVGWENKPMAANYSDACCEIINEYFPNYEYTDSKNINCL